MNILKENLVKNLIAVVIVAIAYPLIYDNLKEIDVAQVPDLLIVLSVLFIAVQFAGFSFSYSDSPTKETNMRMFGHVLTFFAMLLTGLLLATIVIMVHIVYNQFFTIIALLSVLIYWTVFLFDTWDALKLQSKMKEYNN